MARVEFRHARRESSRQWIVARATYCFDCEAMQGAQVYQSSVRQHTQVLHPGYWRSFEMM